MMRNIKPALDLIKKWEGLRLKAYLDPVGVPTIGYGTTIYPDGKKVSISDNSITEAKASEYLMYDVEKRFSCIDDNVEVDLNDNQYGALLSFIYNVGCGAFKSSTLLRKLNASDYKGASNEFKRWNKAGGKVLRGLVNRRKEETELFNLKPQGETSVKDEHIEETPIWLRVLIDLIKSFFKTQEPIKPVQSLTDKILENSKGIGPKMTRMAMKWLDHEAITNKDYAVLIDFDLSERRKRLYVVDLKTGKSERFKVAHASNSDKNKDGIADSFSNVPNSKKSSLGPMVTKKQYGNKLPKGWSKFPYALKLDGLKPGLNDNVNKRAIVFHSSKYVNDIDGKLIGDSWGCPAVSESTAKKIINRIDEGCLFFIYHRTLDDILN